LKITKVDVVDTASTDGAPGSFTDITGLSKMVVTKGPAIVTYSGTAVVGALQSAQFRLVVDGNQVGTGVYTLSNNLAAIGSLQLTPTFTAVTPSLTKGSHTFSIQWSGGGVLLNGPQTMVVQHS
jgi:hypothetical protein